MSVARAAGLLLLADDPTLHDPLARDFTRLGETGHEALADPAGHRRPIYLPLAFHLLLTAWGARMALPLPAVAHKLATRLNEALDAPQVAGDVSLMLWHLSCLGQYGSMTGDQTLRDKALGRVGQVVGHRGEAGSLHPHDPADSLDAWTYCELAGLHALFNMAIFHRDETLRRRCDEVVGYHLDCTQPDNTTNQPWALAAFLSNIEARSFGEQQLHDATAQGRLAPGQGVGWIASLLLADATGLLQRLALSLS